MVNGKLLSVNHVFIIKILRHADKMKIQSACKTKITPRLR